MPKLVTALLLLGSLLAAAPAAASTPGHKLCVGSKKGCHRTIQAAVDAAHDGDTIAVAPGRYAGGVTIDKSIRLVGAGARATVIKGGGPVLTIGRYLAPDPPTVTISGVTITGGVVTSSPASAEYGKEGVVAFGGGIEVSFSADHGPGATLTVKDSVITGNRAAPTASVPSQVAACPGGISCPFAWAKGGGIDSAGPLTLNNTVVSDNTAGGVASDAVGGGISVWETGSLTVVNGRVSGNRALASKPNGRFAEGGGIFVADGVKLAVSGSAVTTNALRLESDLPYFVEGADPIDMNANGGGIHAGTDGDATIEETSISRNSIFVKDPNGRPYAFDSALMTGSGPLVLRNSRIQGNRLFADVGSSEEVGFSGEAMDMYGPATVSHTLFTGNDVVVKSRDGVAAAGGAVYSGQGDETALIVDSVIADNSSRAISATGQATVQGAGLINDGPLRLRGVVISDNSGKAFGPAGFAQGGGIWQGQVFNEGGLPIQLALERTLVTRNRLGGSSGIAVAGGGVFTTGFPISLDRTRIAGNSPDQCQGC
jgi:hypothetical protein